MLDIFNVFRANEVEGISHSAKFAVRKLSRGIAPHIVPSRASMEAADGKMGHSRLAARGSRSKPGASTLGCLVKKGTASMHRMACKERSKSAQSSYAVTLKKKSKYFTLWQHGTKI